MAPRLTQAQKDVLSLYRRGLRLIRTKPVQNRINFLIYLRHAFQHPSQGGGIRQRDFSAIDYMTRRGNRMMEQIFEEKGVKDIHVSKDVVEWYQQKQHAAS
ncbi:hypothetical protein K437DRAFT_266411 [Tilletiaria anomala UBC 951]|uniref:Complex 1 LYR protein domain-containing protein n=1 Tax=Tilletiaria anomala (strain ATCC 24038 / CBS 436.72 / UBC 951) TaxID=1037660 RepID=A0A066WQ49_TILAU|nr:uncharacterized protein K437DRAFT_266411 [Tilletiaria anomala UBC 951]KDN52750.1 hypothetical protein K437DRAFT_266411 [Tilletiaria anomala UBC 951]